MSNRALRKGPCPWSRQLRAGRQLLGADAPALKGYLEHNQRGFLHNSVPQNTTHHMGAVCGSSPALSLLCFWHTLLVCPSEAQFSFSVSDVLCHSSRVPQSLQHPLVFLWNAWLILLLYILKNAKKGSRILEQKCPRHSLSLTSSFYSKVLCGLMKDFLLQELNVLTCQKCPSVIMLHSKDLSLETEMVILCPCSGTTSTISSLVHN